jgi:hypothetical protein
MNVPGQASEKNCFATFFAKNVVCLKIENAHKSWTNSKWS